MNPSNDDDINYEFASLFLLLALYARWQFITFPAAAFERYSHVKIETYLVKFPMWLASWV